VTSSTEIAKQQERDEEDNNDQPARAKSSTNAHAPIHPTTTAKQQQKHNRQNDLVNVFSPKIQKL